MEARRPGQSDPPLTDVLVIAVLITVPLAVVADRYLPSRFSLDAHGIQLIAQGRFAPTEDRSFYNVGRLYGFLGMANRPWLAGLLGIALGGWALCVALRHARGRLTASAVLLIGSYVVLESVYLSQYSKDVWVIPVVLVALLAPAGIGGELVLAGAATLYALNFRSYWFLVVVFYLLLRVVTWRHVSRWRVLVVVIGAVAAVVVLWPVVVGQDISLLRDSTNLGRESSASVTTLITTPAIGSGPVADSLGMLIVLGGLVLPLPLVAIGSPQYLLYAVAIAFLWWALARVTFSGPQGLFVAARKRRSDLQVRWSLLAVAFVMTQSLFEPDYGSYVRHLTPVLPLILAAVFSIPGTPFLRHGEDDDPSGVSDTGQWGGNSQTRVLPRATRNGRSGD